MPRIAVISDTHDRVPPRLLAELAGAETIWHLGDVCNPLVLDDFLEIDPSLRIVRGNCDSHLDWPLVENFVAEGHRVHLEHIPSNYPPPNTDLFLHGHTHVPRDETIGGVRFLNPGCVSRPNRGAPASFAWLTLEKGQPPRWEVVRL